MPTILKTTLMFTVLCWLHPAQAFFCISFGGHAKTKTQPSLRQHYYRPPPPLLLAPRITGQSQPEPVQAMPAIAPAEEEPVIIQGYHFRPLPQERRTEMQSPATYHQQ
ncbi:MAG: hypothetical protein AB2806_16265 [Candidatus Thiodiazotropha sp.]